MLLPKNCLIVDDMPSMVDQFSRYVAHHSQLRVALATSSSVEAMRYIQQHPDRIDLVFTDLEMDEYSGLDILQALENSSIKGFLITGSSITPDQVSAKALIQLLYKPVSLAAFTKAVEQYLELY